MASVLGKKLGTNLLVGASQLKNVNSKNFSSWSTTKKAVVGLATALGGGAAATAAALQYSVSASDMMLHPPSLPWEHNQWLTTLDAASVRRDFQVLPASLLSLPQLGVHCIQTSHWRFTY